MPKNDRKSPGPNSPPARITILADPGRGHPSAQRGTTPWAHYRRMESQLTMRQAREYPRHARSDFEEFRTERIWTLLNKPDGSLFTSFVDFIEADEPYGWGCKWSELRPLLKAEAEARGEDGEKSVQLDELRADGREDNGAHQGRDDKGRMMTGTSTDAGDTRANQLVAAGPDSTTALGDAEIASDNVCRSGERADSTHNDTNRGVATITEKRLRAVARAPELVIKLYRRGLIGVREAAALGLADRDTNADKAALTIEAANAAVAVVAVAPAPKTPTEKRRLQRKVNEAVREALGKRRHAETAPVASLLSTVRSALVKLDRDQRRAALRGLADIARRGVE